MGFYHFFVMNQDFTLQMRQMLERDLKGRGIKDPRLLKAMTEIPRELFVGNSHLGQAYSDGPLPIDCGQTISQPYIVALMTEELKITPDCEVLEIGTGSGYQTAILCKLAKYVYTVERFEELSQAAQKILGELGIINVEFRTGDGSCGWAQDSTFDKILVTAALPTIPQSLIDQLADGGIMVAPVGPTGVQRLVALEKKNDKIAERFICDVRFVRLIGRHGFNE
ncbi:MAG: protein-L-isoaspartate(D-aspartate) O-methyltransferase [Sedimentisphaerales bacterium]|nr:protein-L-isoaspartate(D-aspartate) O-methyltransferase [Sedimentisphaerales bacterium]